MDFVFEWCKCVFDKSFTEMDCKIVMSAVEENVRQAVIILFCVGKNLLRHFICCLRFSASHRRNLIKN